MRKELFYHLADGNKILYAFYKQIYYLTLNPETMKRKLYHKYDCKILEGINYIMFLKKLNKYLTNYDPECVDFHYYVNGIYD